MQMRRSFCRQVATLLFHFAWTDNVLKSAQSSDICFVLGKALPGTPGCKILSTGWMSFFGWLCHWPVITSNGQSRFASPLAGKRSLDVSFFTPCALSLHPAWLTLLWKLIWLVLNVSSCYRAALSLIFLLCVFRERGGREACRILCSVASLQRSLVMAPRKGGRGWSGRDLCSALEWWSWLALYLQNSFRTGSRVSYIQLNLTWGTYCWVWPLFSCLALVGFVLLWFFFWQMRQIWFSV